MMNRSRAPGVVALCLAWLVPWVGGGVLLLPRSVAAVTTLDPQDPANFTQDGTQGYTPGSVLTLTDQSIGDSISFFANDADAGPGVELNLVATFHVRHTGPVNADAGNRIVIDDGTRAAIAACVILDGVKGIGLLSQGSPSNPASYPVFIPVDWEAAPVTIRLRRTGAGDAELAEVNGVKPEPRALLTFDQLPAATQATTSVGFGAASPEARCTVDYSAFFSERAPDKCAGAKLNALAKKEAALLTCQAKVAAKGDASKLAACVEKANAKSAIAFAKAGSCGGDQAVCECQVENCVVAVRNELPEAGPSKCEAARLKAAAKLAAGKLACNAKALAQGAPVDGECIAKAEAKFRAAFGKATGCIGDEGTVEATVNSRCVLPGARATAGAMLGGICGSYCPCLTTGPCTSDDRCCSNTCDGSGQCTCMPAGVPCTSGFGGCCSGICDIPGTGNCTCWPGGTSCQSSMHCCSGSCSEGVCTN